MKLIKSTELFHSSWHQLDAAQAWQVCCFLDQISFFLKNEVYEEYGHTVISLLHICAKNNKIKTIKSFNSQQKVDIYNDSTLFFHKKFTHFFTKKITCGRLILVAPDEDMATTTFGHFSYIDAAYSMMVLAQFHKTDTIQESIDKFIATIFKISDSSFDRQSVSVFQTKINIPKYEKLLIIRAYTNIRANIIDRCPHLFPDIRSDDSKQPEPSYTGEMWRALHFDMADTTAFQGYDATDNANLYDALDYLEKKAKEAWTNQSRK